MTAITLGYSAAGRNAPPAILYCGNDAGTAESIFLAPPDGILRTELIKNPLVTRRRYFDPAAAIAPPAEEKPARKAKPAAPEADLLAADS